MVYRSWARGGAAYWFWPIFLLYFRVATRSIQILWRLPIHALSNRTFKQPKAVASTDNKHLLSASYAAMPSIHGKIVPQSLETMGTEQKYSGQKHSDNICRTRAPNPLYATANLLPPTDMLQPVDL